jgi:hypothetical protein
MRTSFRSFAVRTATVLLCVALAACGSSSSRHLGSGNGPPGGGGNPLPPPSGGGFPPPPPPPDPGAGQVIISGVATFDRVPFSSSGDGLDYTATVDNAPIRLVTVELLASDDSVLGTAQTGHFGEFAFAVASGITVRVRVKAEMLPPTTGTATWDFRVLDNTDEDALYVLDSPPFDTATTTNIEIHAPSGWTGSGYSADPEERSAAPFAILDTMYQNLAFMLDDDSEIELPPLELFWSPNNNPSGDGEDDDLLIGNIGTTFYIGSDFDEPAAIYILGAEDEDTDEFDTHVLAHEWAHYLQDNLARDDSLGGEHFLDERLDLTVAFSEGWANAFSGIVSADPEYRDSAGPGQGMEFVNMDLEDNGLADMWPGWFSEGSIASIIYDLNDSPAGDDDGLSISFGSLRAALEGMADTEAFTSIYPFIRRLVEIESAQTLGIETLLDDQDIQVPVADDFGSTESNFGGDPDNLPVYTEIFINGATERLCVTGSQTAYYNTLGNRRYLRFTVPGVVALPVTITVVDEAGPPLGDPDAYLYFRGEELAGDESLGDAELPLPGDPPLELAPGTHIIDAYDFRWVGLEPPAPFGIRCFDVTVASP